jgi:type IV pilus assembly protein PilA
MYSKGFVFFDIMLTIFIITVLAAVAVPAYQDYKTKSQSAEMSLLTLTIKKAVSDYYAYHGRFPADNQAAGISQQISGNYVSRVNITNGMIQVTFGHRSFEELAGRSLHLQPIVKDNSPLVGIVNWTCNSTTIKKKFLPKFCRK